MDENKNLVRQSSRAGGAESSSDRCREDSKVVCDTEVAFNDAIGPLESVFPGVFVSMGWSGAGGWAPLRIR